MHGWSPISTQNLFLAVEDSSIGDLVTQSVSHWLTFDYSDYNEYNDYNDYNDTITTMTVETVIWI